MLRDDDTNVPKTIHNFRVPCPPAGPEPLKGPFDSVGFPIGCKSACFANLDGNQGESPFYQLSDATNHFCSTLFFRTCSHNSDFRSSPPIANSPNCCSGQYNTPQTCPASGVAYYYYFKDNCPNSYAYAYDESSGTALFTCPSDRKADYTLTFCPPTLNFRDNTGLRYEQLDI